MATGYVTIIRRLVMRRTRKVLDPPMTSIPSGLNPALLSSMTVSRPGTMGHVAGSGKLALDDVPRDDD